MSKVEMIGITVPSFWTLINGRLRGDGGGAMMLWLFYAQKAVDQNSIQPWATDSFCARRLRCSINSIRTWRKTLQRLGMVEHIEKTIKGKKYYFVKVNHLTVTIRGKAKYWGEAMNEGECNSYIAMDYYAKWLEAFRDSDRFIQAVVDEVARVNRKTTIDPEATQEAVEKVWDRISTKGYGISEIDTEFRFFAYMVKAVAMELTRERGEFRIAI